MEKIGIYLTALKTQVLVITETWINEEESQSYKFNNFNLEYICRSKRGGGLSVMITIKLIKENIHICLQNTEDKCSFVPE